MLRPRDMPWRPHPDEREVSEEAEERDAERAALHESLLEEEEGGPRWLLGHLLYYHRRESKSQWWEWFHHLGLDEDELLEDTDTIGSLKLVEAVEDGQSLRYTFSFPPQEHKIDGRCVDPATQRTYNVRVDDELGTVTLRRSKNLADEPLPTALIPGPPDPDWRHRDSIARFARAYRDGEASGPLVEVLERRAPRARLERPCPRPRCPSTGATSSCRSARVGQDVAGGEGGGRAHEGRPARRGDLAQPQGDRKLLAEIEREAREQGFRFRGRKKSSGDDDSRFEGDFIDSSDHWQDLLDPELQLVAGTSWLFVYPQFEGFVDTLIVDEAGQVALADVVAVGHAARSLLFLGDPNQLPQVSQGAMPEQAKQSVLQHLLGDERTVPPGRGIFLAETWRLRPELTAFTSDAYYAGRLECGPPCASGRSPPATRLVFRAVPHVGERPALVGGGGRGREGGRGAARDGVHGREGGGRGRWSRGRRRRTPYNAQVRTLRRRVPAGVRVGTVDKFQGQEAPVVVVSLASSSGEEAPRGLSFVFNRRNRINVATSRAQCRVELRLLAAPAGGGLPLGRGHAARERPLPLRRAGGGLTGYRTRPTIKRTVPYGKANAEHAESSPQMTFVRLSARLDALRDGEEALYVSKRGPLTGVLLDSEHYADLLERLEYLEDSLAAVQARDEPGSPCRGRRCA